MFTRDIQDVSYILQSVYIYAFYIYPAAAAGIFLKNLALFLSLFPPLRSEQIHILVYARVFLAAAGKYFGLARGS